MCSCDRQTGGGGEQGPVKVNVKGRKQRGDTIFGHLLEIAVEHLFVLYWMKYVTEMQKITHNQKHYKLDLKAEAEEYCPYLGKIPSGFPKHDRHGKH